MSGMVSLLGGDSKYFPQITLPRFGTAPVPDEEPAVEEDDDDEEEEDALLPVGGPRAANRRACSRRISASWSMGTSEGARACVRAVMLCT